LNDAFDSGDPYISKPGEYLSDPSKALTHLHPSPILRKQHQLLASKPQPPAEVKLVTQLRLPPQKRRAFKEVIKMESQQVKESWYSTVKVKRVEAFYSEVIIER
jgi:hypothetical protein